MPLKRSIPNVSRWLTLALVLAGAVGAVAATSAQTLPTPTVEVSVGYQTLHIPGQTYPLGIGVGISGALNDLVRIVGEVGLSVAPHTTSSYGTGELKLFHYGLGPRFAVRAAGVLLYGQVLAGAVRTKADLTTAAGEPFDEGDNAFMLQPGVGVMIPFTRRLAVNIEGNYQRVFWKEYGSENETRALVGMRIALH